jgi:hypothetical protein
MVTAYAANALLCLIAFADDWETGAWCAAVVTVLYVIQMISTSRARTGGAVMRVSAATAR